MTTDSISSASITNLGASRPGAIQAANIPDEKIPSLQKGASKEKLEKAAKEFEGIFMNIVLKSMRDTIPDNNDDQGGEGGKLYQSMLDQEYSKISSAKHGLGLSAAIIRQLSPQIEKHSQPEKMEIHEVSNKGQRP